MKIVLGFFVILIIIMSLVLAGCSKESTATISTTIKSQTTTTASSEKPTTTVTTPTAEMPQQGGMLRIIGTEAPVGSLGVPQKALGLSPSFMPSMIEALALWSNAGDIKPILMETFEWGADNLSVTIHLRKNVKFHDGTDFTAEVCKWNLEEHKAAGMDGMENVKSIDIIDNNTIKINIYEYLNTWFGKLGGLAGMMISKSWYESKGADYVDWHPCGTGPFKFVEYKDKEYLLLERFDDYWGGKANLEQIKYLFIADPVTAQISFESGEGDIISVMSGGPKMATELGKKGYTITANPGGLCMVFIPSVADPNSPLANLEVRKAIEYAIDKKAISANVGLGYYKALYQYADATQLPYDPNFQGREYNVEKAKALMKEAGYADGFKTKIIAGSHLAGDEIPAVQAALKEIGIETDIEIVSVAKWIEYETNGWPEGLLESPTNLNSDYGTAILRYLVRPLAPNFYRGLYWNSMYRPDALEEAIQEYIRTPDAAGQLAKAKDIIKIVYDNAIAIPLWESVSISISQPWVHDRYVGFEGFSGPQWNYTAAWMDKH